MMCVNDATVKNVACLVISFPVLMSKTGLKARRNLSQPIRNRYTRKYWPTKTLHLRLLTVARYKTGTLWKKRVHSQIGGLHALRGTPALIWLSLSANVVWFSSSWILNRMCNFTISYFQNNIFLDYKLLRYTAQASAITVFISGDENSSRKYILSLNMCMWPNEDERQESPIISRY